MKSKRDVLLLIVRLVYNPFIDIILANILKDKFLVA